MLMIWSYYLLKKAVSRKDNFSVNPDKAAWCLLRNEDSWRTDGPREGRYLGFTFQSKLTWNFDTQKGLINA